MPARECWMESFASRGSCCASADRAVHCVTHEHILVSLSALKRVSRVARSDLSERHGRAGAKLGVLTLAEESFAIEQSIEKRDAGLGGKRPECLEEGHLLREIGIAQRPTLHRGLDFRQRTALTARAQDAHG